MTISRSWFICFCSLLAIRSAFADGRTAYLSFCAPCHGERGDGRGQVAREFDPRPRDFTMGIYKFRSTASGTLPLASDLRRTVDEGLADTTMPGWRAVLGSVERATLTDYLQSLSPRFVTEPAGEIVPIPPAPPNDAGTISRGQNSYERMRCGDCHGTDGRGNGPSAATLRDDRGVRVRMPDLTRRATLKRVSTDRDIVVTFLTGLDGTPMPSYRDVISPSEAWDLSRYVRNLGRSPRFLERILLMDPLAWKR